MKCYTEFDKTKEVVKSGKNIEVTLHARIMLSKIPGYTYFSDIPEVQDVFIKYGVTLSKHGVYISIKGTGIAKCSPEDEYNEQTGYRIAATRAQADVFDKAATITTEIYDTLMRTAVSGIEGACIANEDANIASKDHIMDIIF